MKIISLAVLQLAIFLTLPLLQAGTDQAALRDEVCLNGTWNLELEGIEKPAQVRVPGSFSGQNQLWGKEHWDVWDYPDDWAKRPATCVRSIEGEGKTHIRCWKSASGIHLLAANFSHGGSERFLKSFTKRAERPLKKGQTVTGSVKINP